MLLDPSDQRPVHFVGVAGAGMSALAELFSRRGVRVTGCDASPDGSADLEQRGIHVTLGHDPSHIESARALVVSSAIPKDHPELARARSLGLPVVRRAEALGEATTGGSRKLVAVAGTHGKSTTTAMTAFALAAAGRDPTALVGARVPGWGGNFRPGGDDLYVVEADEYDRSFLALSPTVAVVTTIDSDHLDVYKNLADIEKAFAQFVSGARYVVHCADDSGAYSLKTPNSAEVFLYGLSNRDGRVRGSGLRRGKFGSMFEVSFDNELLGEVHLRVPGDHNVNNAIGAVAAGLALGAPFDGLARGLAEFTGTERRFQLIGEVGAVTVIDDYAHHPTEITATLDAARECYPDRRLVVAFQPHLYSRTRDFARAFAVALRLADLVFLADIYPAREQPIPGVSADLIAAEFGNDRRKLAWRGTRAGLAETLAASVHPGDVVITMGAGDITKTGPELLRRLGRAA